MLCKHFHLLLLSVIIIILGFTSQSKGQDEVFCFDRATCCVDRDDLTPLGDWGNCTIWYVCFGGIASTPYSCSNPENPLYNPETQQCTNNVDGCVGFTRDPQLGSTIPSTSDPITSTTQGPPVTDTTTFTPSPGNCTEDGVYFIPYPGDCSKYMICSNGVLLPNVQSCNNGTLFDPLLGQCNREDLVECKPTCPVSEDIIFLPHDKNCSLYWICIMGTATLQQCLPRFVFDPKLNECNFEERVLCPNTCPENEIAYLPHASNCSLYWLCVMGDPNLRQCAPDLFFDIDSNQCDLTNNCNRKLNVLGIDDYQKQQFSERNHFLKDNMFDDSEENESDEDEDNVYNFRK